MTTIAERLRELRKRKGLSQTEVAKLLGVNRTTYVHYETGYSKPTQKLEALCSLFNLKTGDTATYRGFESHPFRHIS